MASYSSGRRTERCVANSHLEGGQNGQREMQEKSAETHH